MTNPIERLPHREPFVFLTRVISLEPGASGQATWEVRGGEDFFRGHFPGDPIVPGVLIGEALAQLCGLVGVSTGAARLAQIDVRFDSAVRPPAAIELRSMLDRTLGALTLYKVEALVCGTTVARGIIVLGAV